MIFVAEMDFLLTMGLHPNVMEQANIRAVPIMDTAVLELNIVPVLDVLTIDQEQVLVR